MRIIAGSWRGCTLQAPAGLNTRPTADRARQTLFDMIRHAAWGGRSVIADQPVLDVFAGSGALGLEALSRGASHVTFIEQDKAALACLRANIQRCDAMATSKILSCSALNPLKGTPCKIVFLDPPYRQDLLPPTLAALQKQGWINQDTLIVAETASDESSPTSTMLLAERSIGAAKFHIWRENF